MSFGDPHDQLSFPAVPIPPLNAAALSALPSCSYTAYNEGSYTDGVGEDVFQGTRRLDTQAARIVDANINRAREGLRVMEEYARFILNDAAMAHACKQLRHRLVHAFADRQTLLASARDVFGDVGTTLQGQGEGTRGDASSVAHAAAARVGEALRVIEEYAKIDEPALATAIERMRYDAYTVQRRLLLHAHATRRFGGVRLYVILTESLCVQDWFRTAERAFDGGAQALQLREKNLADRTLVERARRLVALGRERERLVLINDRPDIAVLSGADGVHVGQDDLAVRDARAIVGPNRIVGVSTHNIEQVRASLEMSPDYVAVGPMFPTQTRPREQLAGPGTLRMVRELTSLPRVAIGGIAPGNASLVLDADRGACLCVCRAVIGEPDPAEAAARLLCMIESRSQQRPYDG